MATGPFPGRPFQLRDNVVFAGHDIPNNRSLLNWELWIDKTGFSPTYSSGKASRWMRINGQFVHEYYGNGFDFRNGDHFLIASGQVWVPHNADGTKSFAIEAAADFALLGATSLTFSPYVLPTIPRASTASFPNGSAFDAGAPVQINTNRASGSFTHDITYQYGNLTGTIATGVQDSTSWTPPLSLLTQSASSVTGVGTITVVTKNGGSAIGTTRTGFTLRAPATVVPTVSTITADDRNPDVVSIVGKFVQGLSRARLAVSGVGAQGSTIKSATATLLGLTVNSGGEIAVTKSGNLPVTAKVTDSRGRVGNGSGTLQVLDYSPPAVSSYKARRSSNIGALQEDGVYLRVDLSAAIASLINGTQRNALTIRAFTRPRGTGAWTARNVVVPGGLTYASWFLVSGGGIFSTTSSWDVRVQVEDKFGTYIADTTVSTIQVALDMNGKNLGVGKIHERGVLDVGGGIYASGDIASDLDMYSRSSKVVTEANFPDRVGAASATGYNLDAITNNGWYSVAPTTPGTHPPYDLSGNPTGYWAVEVNNVGGRSIQVARPWTGNTPAWRRHRNIPGDGSWTAWELIEARETPWTVPTLTSGWGTYSGETAYYRVRNGLCALAGRITGQTSAGTTIFTLPAQARHTAPVAMVFNTHSDNGSTIILVGSDGNVVIASRSGLLRQGVSLAGIQFPVG